MLWFDGNHLPFLLCGFCHCILHQPKKCKNCELTFHEVCIKMHEAKCINSGTRKDGQKDKVLTSIPVPNILDLKKVFLSFQEAHSYARKKILQDLPVVHKPQERIKCCSCANVASLFYRKPFCEACMDSIKRNEYCPICLKVYDANNYDVEMMCCDLCLRWVHLKCDRAFMEKYYNNTQEVEYQCPKCVENAERWLKIKESLAKSKSHSISYNLLLSKACNSKQPQVLCAYCGEESANDPLFFLEPIEGTMPTRFSHKGCRDYAEEKCMKCGKKNSSVKCPECRGAFHLVCAESLFRQEKLHPMCAQHIYIPATDDTGFLEKIYTLPEHREKAAAKRRFKNINLLFGNVIYQPSCFVKLLFSKDSVNFLKFESLRFLINGEPSEIKDVKRLLGLDVEKNDVFRLKSQAYITYRKRLRKSQAHEEVLKGLLGIYSGSTKYFFR